MSATATIDTLCAYCGVGCGLALTVTRDAATGTSRVVGSKGRKEHPTNFGRLCTKGATTADMLAAPGRMTTALVRPRRGEPAEPAPTDEAIASTAARLRAIVDEHGPDAVALYVSGQMSLEAQYLTNKLAKGFIGTNQIESNSRLCMASAGSGYKQSLGADGPPGSYQDLDSADLFFVIGANMADCHPILFLRMMDRVKAGAKLVVVDPRRTATAEKADLFLQVAPGTDLALLNGLLHLIVANGHVDEEFVAEHTEGWDAMADFLADYPPGEVARITGIPEEDLRTAARWIGEAGAWTSCWTMGLNQSTHGTWNTNALCNLHLATGAICRPGAGPFSLTGQPNAMGGREMGYMGPGLPGQRAVTSDEDRAFVEERWGLAPGTLRTDVGGGTIDMFSRMAEGEIKACWIICTNPVATVANRSTVLAGLERAELVITQDAFEETETNAYADVVLPAALWSESEGVMINSERNLTLFRPALPALGEALPDWQIIARVACAMGYEDAFTYSGAEEIFEEIKGFWNPRTGYDLRGVTYDRLRRTPVQWPAPPDRDEDRNPIRYLNDGVSQTLLVRPDGTTPRLAFPTPSGRAVFHPRPHMPPKEMPDDDYPFLLNTGRLPHQWHTMTKTGKVAKLNKLNPGPFVEIHPGDADRLGIGPGDSVEVASRRGRAVLPAVVTDRVLPGSCFAPFHWNDVFGEYLAINAVTNDAIDPVSQQPEFKACAVSLVRVAAAATPPDTEPDGTQAPDDVPATQDAVSSAAPGAGPAVGSGAADRFAAALGLQPDAPPPALDPVGRDYLAGMLVALRTGGPERAETGAGAPSAPAVPVLPPTAPLDPSTRAWVDGLLAGMYSWTSVPGALPQTAPVPALPTTYGTGAPAVVTDPAESVDPRGLARAVLVLWASQTGNAEEVAATCASRLADAGVNTELRCMDDVSVADLADVRDLLLVSSTTGDGEPPDNGAAFWTALTADAAPRLERTRFALLGLGDSSYDTFCGHARALDDRLAGLGAERLLTRVDCEPDYDDDVETWMVNLVATLTAPPSGGTTSAPASPAAGGTAVLTSPARAVVVETSERPAPTPVPTATEYSRRNPLRTRVTRNDLLSGPGSAKEVRRIGLHLPPGTLTYTAGDALGVLPRNRADLVEEWLTLTGLSGDAAVVVPGNVGTTLREALTERYEIARPTPDLLRFVASRSGSAFLTDLLRSEDRAELERWTRGRQAVDVLTEHEVTATPEEWLEVLKPLQARQYSISSSPRTDPEEVQLTISTVRYPNASGTATRHGVCSSFLADGASEDVAVYVQGSAHFGPPQDPQARAVMIGPGTGIAPFRGFLHDRRAAGHTGQNWLLFGEQHEATDYYYRDEIEDMLRGGTLAELDLAFSRDQQKKVYVQDRLRERGALLWRWLEDGAHVYVCGDASRMAKDVDRALREIVGRHGGLEPAAADAYVRALASSKRYVRDVY